MRLAFLAIIALLPISAWSQMKKIDAGTFKPIYGSGDGKINVNAFHMDPAPVTNAEYLIFVKQMPKWQKSKVKALFADKQYLANWVDDLNFPKALEQSPVTNVSWYAAKAYCECQGKRLPTVNEWEFAAMANEKVKDARKDSLNNARLLDKIQTPNTNLQKVKQSKPNVYGIYDMHGLIWEWTYDFNSVMLSGENRNNNDKNQFCGAGSLNANDLMNYVSFMRYAFRSSVKAHYTISNLGFRCAK